MASGIEGIRDAVIDGKNGYLLQSGNAEEYIQTLKEISANLSSYSHQREVFREFTVNHYSWDAIAEKYCKILQPQEKND